MFTRHPTRQPEVAWLGLTLTGVAGFIDAVGFLTLGQIYVANMSGNTVSLAIHLSQRAWGLAWAHGCPLLAFVPGLIAGDMIVELCKRWRLRAALWPVIAIESVAVLAFFLIASRAISPHGTVSPDIGLLYAVLIGLLAFSMGLQNGALRQIGALKDVHTYVTGTLLAAAHGFSRYLFWVAGRLRKPTKARIQRAARYSWHHRSLRKAMLAASLWLLYVAGAILGTLGRARFGIFALLAPLVILVFIVFIDLIRPIHNRHRFTGEREIA